MSKEFILLIKNIIGDEIEAITPKILQSTYEGITNEEMYSEVAKICSNMITINPSYGLLGGKILAAALHEKTSNSFVDTMIQIQTENNILDSIWLKWIIENKEELDSMIDYTRDYDYDYFGFKTLERSYLLKSYKTNLIYERPQHLFMRVASFINRDIEMVRSTYNLLSTKQYTHATPTLFNAGTSRPQLSSCFLLNTNDDLEGITKTWNQVSMISKWAGGIGLHISNIRAKGSIIRSTNGESCGIVPMLQVYNNIARYINQGGKRKGSFAIYLEPHHADIFEFLELRKNTGSETERTRDLFTALWVSDIFMEMVEQDKDWYLMCPDECPNLNEVYGDAYKNLYTKYIVEGKYRKKVSARKLMEKIMESQLETGTPYILYKDHINKKSNQKNIGIVKSSNLCAEIVQVSNNEEHAVCNLASICLNMSLVKFNCTKSFIIYTKPGCIYCTYAKNYMNYYKYPYEEEFSPPAKKFKCEDGVCKIGQVSYPMIYYGDKYIGGFNELIHFTADTFDYNNLWNTAYITTKNLNRVIDINYYPTIETKCSNLRNRPIGLGIQGLADTLAKMKIQFDSDEAVEFNGRMMETIYNAAITASKDIARDRYDDLKVFIKNHESIPKYYDKNLKLKFMNEIYHKHCINRCELKLNDTYGAYSSYDESPISKGILQFDMWETMSYPLKRGKANQRFGLLSESNAFLDLYQPYNWDKLRQEIKKYGVRNSLVTALMPTASTSQIMGNNECFEHHTSNIYTRRTLAGDFQMVNRHMVDDLLSIGLWNNDLKQTIIASNGSINREYKLLQSIPPIYRSLYKTIWEIKQIWVLKHARARAPFVDQTQSMNIFMDKPNYKKLFSCHMWAWKNGLKTGMYYLRTNAAEDAIKVTIDPKLISNECESCSA